MFRCFLQTVGALRIFPGVGKLKVSERKYPSGVRDGAPVRVWGRNPQKQTTGSENNVQIIRLLSILL